MSHSKRVFLPILVLLISVALVGCGNGREEKAPEKGALKDTGIRVKVHMEDDQGKKTTIEGYGKVVIPPEFPKDIMVYPGAEVREAIMAESGDGCFLRLEIREPREKILSTYKDKMKAKDGRKLPPPPLAPYRRETTQRATGPSASQSPISVEEGWKYR